MHILIAEDDSFSRLLLQRMLAEWGYAVTAVADGTEAWQVLQRDDAPPMAVLDWIMPGVNGVEVCRLVRERPTTVPPYLILLTARDATGDVVTGLQSGANDYVTKPFDRDELQARIAVGRTVVELQQSLAARVLELEDALAHVKQLRGLLPICSYCKKIRDDQNYWRQVEDYISQHTDARFTHGICPDCYDKEVRPQLDQWGAAKSADGPAAGPA